LTRISRLQGSKISVELLGLSGIVGESRSIQCRGASSDEYRKDGENKERRKLHLEF